MASFKLVRGETFYRKLDAGLCCGQPAYVEAGTIVREVEPAPSLAPGAGWRLMQATLDSGPAYCWLYPHWLEPINQQQPLFETEQPKLFGG